MNACSVEINGESWYIPCDRVNDLGFDNNNNLIVLTNSSLTLYKTFSNSNTTSYPRVSCAWGRVCSLQTAQNVSSYLNDVNLSVSNRLITDDFFTFLFLVLLLWGLYYGLCFDVKRFSWGI